MDVYTGCSGFYYDDWKGEFYPTDIPKKKWLEYYADQFNSVEINNTFYKIPARKDLQAWMDRTPDNFRFVCKGSRFITHMKKLNVDQRLLSTLHDYYDGIEPLENKLAGILWQFPSNFPVDRKRIEKFSKHLKKEIPNFFEFRKPEWYTRDTADFLSDLGLGMCTISAPGYQFQAIFESNNWAYLRLHGKYNWYDYEYSVKELKDYKKQILEVSPDQTYIFFNNDIGAKAPVNAHQMQKLF